MTEKDPWLICNQKDKCDRRRCPKCGYKTRKYGTVESAIEAWNRRAK